MIHSVLAHWYAAQQELLH